MFLLIRKHIHNSNGPLYSTNNAHVYLLDCVFKNLFLTKPWNLLFIFDIKEGEFFILGEGDIPFDTQF